MALGLERKQLVMVAVLLAGAFVAVLNATLLTPALPTIMRDMQVESTTVQWLTSGYALIEAVVIPLAAYLMGRFSTRRLFISGISFFALGSLVAALSPAFPFLLAGRMIQAACTGAVMPMVMSVVLLEFPREKRGSAMGIVGLLIGFAPAIGPSLSGVLIDTVGWRWIFGIVAIISVGIAVVASVTLRNAGMFKRTKFDFPSVVFSTIGLLSLLYGLSTFSSSENHLTTVALVAVGAVLLAIYAHRQLHLEEPMLRISILKTRNYRTVVVIIMLFQAALIGMETVMPLYIQGVLGHPATVSGLALLPGAVIGAITGLFAGRLFDRHGVRGLVITGAVAITAASFGFVFFQVDSPIVFVSAVYAVMAIGIQFTMTPLNTWGVNSLPNDAIQHAQSTSNTLNQVAGSFGTALIVSIAAAVSNSSGSLDGVARTFAGYHASFATTATLAIVAVILILLFVRDRKKAPSAAAAPVAVSSKGENEASVAPTILVRDAMNANAATVPVGSRMSTVISVMAKADTTGVSVVEPDGTLIAYITDGDVANYLARHDMNYSSLSGHVYALFHDDADLLQRMRDLSKVDVMDLATTHVISVEDTMPLDEACRVLSERRIKKVPVTHDGVLVGALSRRNVMHYMLDAIAEEDPATAAASTARA